MSKTAQRKRSAYSSAYNVARYGWPDGVKSYRIRSMAADTAWKQGFADGKRDRADHYRPSRTFWQTLKFIFGLYRKP